MKAVIYNEHGSVRSENLTSIGLECGIKITILELADGTFRGLEINNNHWHSEKEMVVKPNAGNEIVIKLI